MTRKAAAVKGVIVTVTDGRRARGEPVRVGRVLGVDLVGTDLFQLERRDTPTWPNELTGNWATTWGCRDTVAMRDDPAGQIAVGVLDGNGQPDRLSSLDAVGTGLEGRDGRSTNSLRRRLSPGPAPTCSRRSSYWTGKNSASIW